MWWVNKFKNVVFLLKVDRKTVFWRTKIKILKIFLESSKRRELKSKKLFNNQVRIQKYLRTKKKFRSRIYLTYTTYSTELGYWLLYHRGIARKSRFLACKYIKRKQGKHKNKCACSPGGSHRRACLHASQQIHASTAFFLFIQN